MIKSRGTKGDLGVGRLLKKQKLREKKKQEGDSENKKNERSKF